MSEDSMQILAALLSAAESLLCEDAEADVFRLLQESPLSASHEAELELAALKLSFGEWSARRLPALLEVLRTRKFTDEEIVQSLRMAYSNRICSGIATEWEGISSAGFSASALRLANEDEPVFLGQILADRFRADCRVGAGGTGVVFRGWDLAKEMVVALKVPRVTGVDQPIAALFRREMEAARAVNHSGVPIVDELCIDGSMPVLVSQFVDGPSLRRRLDDEGRMESYAAAKIIVSVLEPLAAAHEIGITHLDVTPSNILFDKRGKVYVTDFGIAVQERELLKREGSYTGTSPYAAPESLFGAAVQFDGRTDLWSIGAILYEMLNGTQVNADDSREGALVRAIASDSAAMEFLPEVPETLAAICRQCLQRQMNLRFPSAPKLATALRAFLEGNRVEGAPDERSWFAWQSGWLLGKVQNHHERFASAIHEAAEKSEISAADQKELAVALLHGVNAEETSKELVALARKSDLQIEPLRYEPSPMDFIYRRMKLDSAACDGFAKDTDRAGRLLQTQRKTLGQIHGLNGEEDLFHLADLCAILPIKEDRSRFLSLCRRTSLPESFYGPVVSLPAGSALEEALRAFKRKVDRHLGKASEED